METPTRTQEKRLQGYDHVVKRDEIFVGRRVMGMKTEDRRGIGKPRRRWMNCAREDLREKQLSDEDVYDLAGRRRPVRNIDFT